MSRATLAAFLLAALSVAATLSVIDYPLGAAWDEAVKLRGVSIGRYRYYHPLFMIDLAQAVALMVQPISNIGMPLKATTCRCCCNSPRACSICARACGPGLARRCWFSA